MENKTGKRRKTLRELERMVKETEKNIKKKYGASASITLYYDDGEWMASASSDAFFDDIPSELKDNVFDAMESLRNCFI